MSAARLVQAASSRAGAIWVANQVGAGERCIMAGAADGGGGGADKGRGRSGVRPSVLEPAWAGVESARARERRGLGLRLCCMVVVLLLREAPDQQQLSILKRPIYY